MTGVFGVFTSLDLFFYYFFYELAVIPMFLLIGIWGSTTRTVDKQYATMKLVLMLSMGAVLALVGLLAIYSQGGTFDMVMLEELELSKGFQMIWVPGDLHRVRQPHSDVAAALLEPGGPRGGAPPPSRCCTRAC